MGKKSILITCPPMLGMKDQFLERLACIDIDAFCPQVTQTLSEDELIKLTPDFDGWIIGDDPVTRDVLFAGTSGKLRAAVKWGIGTDNIDFAAFEEFNIPIENTPGVFGDEVADLAIGYLIGLARETYYIDREVRNGNWPKNRGISLRDKTVAIIGYGDIGSNLSKKLIAFGMHVIAYDPYNQESIKNNIEFATWPNRLEECDFIIFACQLNDETFHMFNSNTMDLCKDGVRIINVSRGPLIDEETLVKSLESGKIHSAALDVFESEPLPINSELRANPACIFGSHNGSNTNEAVIKTNNIAIAKLLNMLGIRE
jgi:D-3-phosphoglycerate dehydrogenase / 2-oxoglutarate reductase